MKTITELTPTPWLRGQIMRLYKNVSENDTLIIKVKPNRTIIEPRYQLVKDLGYLLIDERVKVDKKWERFIKKILDGKYESRNKIKNEN